MGLNYLKDYKNNRKIEIYKDKKDRLIEGSALIEIYNKDGSKDKEIYTENTLTNIGIKEMFYYATLNKNAVKDSNIVPLSNFGSLFLTDYCEPENPLEREIKGNIIGFANSSVPRGTAMNTKEGTINITNSKIDYVNKQIILSFDFGHDKAIGSFQSIFFGAGQAIFEEDKNSKNGLYYAPSYVEKVEIPGLIADHICMSGDGVLWSFKDKKATNYRLFTIGNIKTFKKNIDVNLTNFNTNIKCVRYVQADSCFWIFGEDNNIYRYNKEMHFIEIIPLLTRMLNNKVVAFKDLFCFHIQEKNLIVHNIVTNKIIKQIDNFIERDAYAIFIDKQYMYLYLDNATVAVYNILENKDTIDFKLICINAIPNTSREQDTKMCYLYKYPTTPAFLDVAGDVVYILKSINSCGAHTRLPSAVSKGFGQYMVINYMFKFA